MNNPKVDYSKFANFLYEDVTILVDSYSKFGNLLMKTLQY